MSDPFISVIVLNWNGLRHLEVVLRSLIRQDYPADKFEILFADNGSTDDSIEFVRKNWPQIRILKFDRNYGFAEGNNRAVSSARGEVLAFLNNDTEADPGWLRHLVAAYQNDPHGLYGSQAYQFAHRDISANSLMKQLAWGVPTNVNVFLPRSAIAQQTVPTFYADAAAMLINKDLFLKLGGFNKTYFAYEEEKDLSWKAWILGYSCYLVPTSVFYHQSGATLGQNSPQALYLLWRNGLRNLLKYPETRHVWRMFAWHILYSLGTFLFIYIPMQRWSSGWTMLKAYWAVLWHLPSLMQERKIIQDQRRYPDQHMKSLGLELGLVASLKFTRAFLRRRKI